MINKDIQKAYKVLEGETLTKETALALSELKGEEVMDLVSLGHKVRKKYAAKMDVCSIVNAKSGLCSENCKFCAQSTKYNTGVEQYKLLPTKKIVESAGRNYDVGVRTFGLVTSGTGYKKKNAEFDQLMVAIDEVKNTYPEMKVCGTFGVLSKETAPIVAKHVTGDYNINLQTSPKRYSELVSDTHTVEERIDTIRLLKENGVKVCSGGIIGLGENMEDRIDLAIALHELDVDVIPLNILIPIPGTPLEKSKTVSMMDIVKTVAIFRLINPTKSIKIAAGRETKAKDFQSLLLLAGANGYITGDYLTTRGRDKEEDIALEKELAYF